METTELMVDFYNGAPTLQIIAAWAHAVADPPQVLGQLTAFARAYEQLGEQHEAGKVGVGAADFSAENRARVQQLLQLLRSGLDSSEARRAANEVRVLAERCLQGLAAAEGSDREPQASGST